jgi:hypothetical protein
VVGGGIDLNTIPPVTARLVEQLCGRDQAARSGSHG